MRGFRFFLEYNVDFEKNCLTLFSSVIFVFRVFFFLGEIAQNILRAADHR